MAHRFGTTHEGRRVEVEPVTGSWTGGGVRLLVDGEVVAEARGSGRVTVRADGLTARARLAWHGERLAEAELVVDGEARPIPLDPPPGTLAARREAFARRHPALHAARHVLAGTGQVLLGLLGLSVLLRLLPEVSIDLPLPSIDLPLPSVGLPLPDLPQPPAWVRAVLDSAKLWGPVLAGCAYALVEYRRRRRQRTA